MLRKTLVKRLAAVVGASFLVLACGSEEKVSEKNEDPKQEELQAAVELPSTILVKLDIDSRGQVIASSADSVVFKDSVSITEDNVKDIYVSGLALARAENPDDLRSDGQWGGMTISNQRMHHSSQFYPIGSCVGMHCGGYSAVAMCTGLHCPRASFWYPGKMILNFAAGLINNTWQASKAFVRTLFGIPNASVLYPRGSTIGCGYSLGNSWSMGRHGYAVYHRGVGHGCNTRGMLSSPDTRNGIWY